ncbi:centromere W-like isoform X1 [Labeo rohita]|uniref:Centromere W-like isoform X1 n=1 Tax=Labeo rohita TaxID=84645 RepID=A0A498LF77_LABRO|nr:centromere W-like isoform X1 [Labeo rohita]
MHRYRAQLNLLVVLHRLAEESRVKAFEEKSGTIKVHHVRAVAKGLGLFYLSRIPHSSYNAQDQLRADLCDNPMKK